MSSVYHYALLPFALILFIRAAESLSDQLQVGSAYLMSAVVGGNNFYLGCGDDYQCSILPISDAGLHDGWTAHNNGDGSWGFRIRYDAWALDVQSNGFNIFADATISSSLLGELWVLYPWPDGTYRLYNNLWQSNLDVEDNATPFMNSKLGDTLLGQRWYFRSVAPQTIVTSTTTSTSFNNAEATSTVTLTVTTCLGKRDEGEATHLLKKRGSEILSTTTQTSWVTSIVTSTEIGGTQVSTSTDTVFSCQPTTVATTQPGTTIIKVSTASPTPSPAVVTLSTATPSTQGSISTQTGAGSSVVTIFTAASAAPTAHTSASRPVYSFQAAMIGWIFLFWIIIVVTIITL